MSRASEPNSSAADKKPLCWIRFSVEACPPSTRRSLTWSGKVRVGRRTGQTGAIAGRTFSGDDIAILRPEETGQLKERQALVLADNGKPIIAHLARCIDGKAGRRLKSGPGWRLSSPG